MSYCIILRGSLGVGKTTMAKGLTKRLDAIHFPFDDVLQKNNLDTIDEQQGCIPTQNFITAHKLILPEIQKNIQQKKIVILDACFYHKEVLKNLIKNIPCPYYVFTLQASLETCIERDKTRAKTYGEGAATAVYNLVSQFDYGVIIHTDQKSEEEILKEIISYLSE